MSKNGSSRTLRLDTLKGVSSFLDASIRSWGAVGLAVGKNCVLMWNAMDMLPLDQEGKGVGMSCLILQAGGR
jgi:hypothetical protein